MSRVKCLTIFCGLTAGLIGSACNDEPPATSIPESVKTETGEAPQTGNPAPTPTPTPVMVVGDNWVEDANFAEGRLDPRFALINDQAEFSVSNSKPIEGTHSLVLINQAYGSGIRWTRPVSKSEREFQEATSMLVSALVRGDLVSILNRLYLCARAEYTDGFIYTSCSWRGLSAGQVARLQTELPLDTKRELEAVSFSFESRGVGTIQHSIDQVSAQLKTPAPQALAEQDFGGVSLESDFIDLR
jgi:hypothetical protein